MSEAVLLPAMSRQYKSSTDSQHLCIGAEVSFQFSARKYVSSVSTSFCAYMFGTQNESVFPRHGLLVCKSCAAEASAVEPPLEHCAQL